MTKEQVALEVIKTTAHECTKCGEWQGNLSKHVKKCNGTRHLTAQTPVNKDLPAGFEPNGRMTFPLFEEFMGQQSLAEGTLRQYLAKTKEIWKFWEQDINSFKTDALLWALDLDLTFPSLSRYLYSCETDTARIKAIKSYKYFANFIYETVDLRYTADARFTMEKKAAFASGLEAKVNKSTGKLKTLNKVVAQNTARNAHTAEQSGLNLAYNPIRLGKLLDHVLKHPKLNEMLERLREITPAQLVKEFREIDVRNLLLGMLLITGDGHRPHAYPNMTIDELMKAVYLEDGVYTVSILDHKTLKHHGSCNVPFLIDGLYEMTVMFVETFRYVTFKI